MKKLHILTFIAGVFVGAATLGSAFAVLSANPATSRLFINGAEVHAEAYNIDGSNYFKLRDIAKAVGFSVEYDSSEDTISLDTTKPYTEPTAVTFAPAETPFPFKVGDSPSKCSSKSDYTFAFPNSPLAKKFAFYLNTFGVGGCNWYAEGRFLEVNGINIVDYALEDGSNALYSTLDYFECAKRHTERLEIITDIRDIRSKAAVFCYSAERGVSHMLFCEYVEHDADGNPINIYLTEANSQHDGIFHDGLDGVVKMLSFDDFVGLYCPIGYAVKKK